MGHKKCYFTRTIESKAFVWSFVWIISVSVESTKHRLQPIYTSQTAGRNPCCIPSKKRHEDTAIGSKSQETHHASVAIPILTLYAPIYAIRMNKSHG